MPKYYSLMLSPNISKTVQGYLICENVPICRSGFQEYLGRELVGFPGYEESWNLDPETRYKIYRPKESVLDPEFIKSIEGNTVVDEHPDGSVVHVNNDGELNCGHIEKVGRGPDQDGEVTLKGDLHIKNPELIEKIRPEEDPDADYAIRDVSLGYSLRLSRLDDGTIIMTHLRGNHTAVVEKGRAGPRIAIQDSAIPETKQPKPEIKIKEINMSWTDKIFGLGWKAFATDASPEDVMSAAKELGKPAEGAKPEEKKEEKEAHHEHMAACKDYCEKGGDKEALMSFLKGEHHAAKDADETLEELQEQTKEDEPSKPAGEEKQEEKTAAEEGDEMTTDADEIDDSGESVLKQANDSVRNLIKAQKPMIALIINKPKSKRNAYEQTMVDSYNSTVKSLNLAGGRAYSKLTVAKTPARIEAIATDSTSVTKAETICTCFDGVPHRVGQKRHDDGLCRQKGTK